MKRRYEDAETGAVVTTAPDRHGAKGVHWLTNVSCPVRRRGEGGATRAMRAACYDADAEAVELRLMIIPRPNTDLLRLRRREWYRGFGFFGLEEMARVPRTSGVGWPD